MESLIIWGLVLLGVSLLLIIAEVFIPSAGLISLTAAAVGIAGLVCLYKVSWTWGLSGTLAMLVLSPTVAYFGLNLMPSTPMGRKLLFGEAGEERPVLGDTDAPQSSPLAALVGLEGEAATDLRPIGTVKIAMSEAEPPRRYDARAEVAFIRAGTRVRVTGVADGGIEVYVRPVV